MTAPRKQKSDQESLFGVKLPKTFKQRPNITIIIINHQDCVKHKKFKYGIKLEERARINTSTIEKLDGAADTLSLTKFGPSTYKRKDKNPVKC